MTGCPGGLRTRQACAAAMERMVLLYRKASRQNFLEQHQFCLNEQRGAAKVDFEDMQALTAGMMQPYAESMYAGGVFKKNCTHDLA